MLNQDYTHKISERTKKVKFNLNNSSKINNQKKSSLLRPIYPKIKSLTNTSQFKKDNIIEIDGKKEKILLSDQVKAKNRFNTTHRFAVLTNSRICVYYSEEKFLLYKYNPYKIFLLKEHKFEVDKKILIIKGKEEHSNEEKYKIIKKYEFSNKETAIKWWETIIASMTLNDIKSNNFLKDDNSTLNEELIGNNSNISYNLNQITNNTINDNENKDNTNINTNVNIYEDEKNKKYNELSTSVYGTDNIQNEEENKERESNNNYTESNIYIGKEKEDNDEEKKENEDEIRREENIINIDNIDDNKKYIIKSKYNNNTLSPINSVTSSEEYKDNQQINQREINTKSSFRYLLKEEINKIENEDNNCKNSQYTASDIEKDNNYKSKSKQTEGNNSNNYLLSSVNNNNKNIYSFGKQDLNYLKNNNNTNKKEKNNSSINLDINLNTNNFEKSKNDISNNIDENDLSESNNIKIKDLSDIYLYGNETININKSFINENINNSKMSNNNLKKSDINKVEKNSYNIIKLMSCEKDSNSKSDFTYELSNSNKKNDILKENMNRNEIRSSFLVKNNSNVNPKQNINMNSSEKDIISHFSEITNSSKNININSYKSNNYNIKDGYKNENVIKSKVFCKNNNFINNSEDEDNKNEKIQNISRLDNYSKITEKDEDNTIKNDFKDINEIKMFDSQSELNENNNNSYEQTSSKANNNSLYKSPQINNFCLENNNNDSKKIFYFSKESEQNKNLSEKNKFSSSKKNSNQYHDNEPKSNCSNDIYTDIYEDKNIKKQNELNSNKKTNNSNYAISPKNTCGSSILIIDKNNPLLNKSFNNEEINSQNENKIENDQKYNNVKILINKKENTKKKREIKIQKVIDNFNIINTTNIPNINKNGNFNNMVVDNQDKFNILQNQNEFYIKNEKSNLNNKIKTNNLLKNSFKHSHFEFQYARNNCDLYKTNIFINKEDNKKIQKVINFFIDKIKEKYILDNYVINDDSLMNKYEYSDNDKTLKNVQKCHKSPFKNRSVDKINHSYLNLKNNNNIIYQKKLNNSKRNKVRQSTENFKKTKNHSIQTNLSINNTDFNLDYINFKKNELSKNDEQNDYSLINDNYENTIDNTKINHNNFYLSRNYRINENDYNKNTIKHSNNFYDNNSFDKVLDLEYSYDNDDDSCLIPFKPKKINLKYDFNKGNLDINLNKAKRNLSTITNIYNNKKIQDYSFIEKTFNLIDNNNVNKKITPSKLIENILIHRYSKHMLLYCYNQGMTNTTFIPQLQDNLKRILENNKKYIIILKYLFVNIPNLIRNRLQRKDLQLIFGPNNYNNHLSNFNNEKNTYRNYNADRYSYVKEEIKKLIINDNKYVVKMLNEYYENINDIRNRYILYKYKKQFIQEMKNLNADIVLS